MSDTGSRRWARVAAEFFVIVAGVLAALAVDQWQDSREDQRREREYMVRLVADLEETRQSVMDTAEHFRLLVDHGLAVQAVLNRSTPFPQDTLGFLKSALQVSRAVDPVVSRGAYDDLISTGNLRLFRNEVLRDRLSAFYGNVNNELSPFDYNQDKTPYRNTIRGLLTLEAQLVIRGSCLDTAPLTCETNEEVLGLRQMVEGVLTEPYIDRQMTVALQSIAIRLLREGVAGGFRPVLEQIEEVLVLLRAELDTV